MKSISREVGLFVKLIGAGVFFFYLIFFFPFLLGGSEDVVKFIIKKE